MNKTIRMRHYYALSFVILFVHCELKITYKFSVLGAVLIILISLPPAVVLVFSVKCAKCKTKKVGDILSRKSSTFICIVYMYTLILVKTGVLN